MFVIRRSDGEYSKLDENIITTLKIHETLEFAETEAKRLATKYASENPKFIIFELKEKKVVSARIEILIQ